MQSPGASQPEEANVNLCLAPDGRCLCSETIMASSSAYSSGLPPPRPVEPGSQECYGVTVPPSIVNTMLQSTAGYGGQSPQLPSHEARSRSPSPCSSYFSQPPRLIFAPSAEELQAHYRYAVDYFYMLEQCSDNSTDIEDCAGGGGYDTSRGSARPQWASRNRVRSETAEIRTASETVELTPDMLSLFSSRRGLTRISFLNRSVAEVTGERVRIKVNESSSSLTIEGNPEAIKEACLQVQLMIPNVIDVSEFLWEALIDSRKDSLGLLAAAEGKLYCRVHVERIKHEVKVFGPKEAVEKSKHLFHQLDACSSVAEMMEAVSQC